MVRKETTFDDLDIEWVALILEAKKLGISKEGVLNFLNNKEGKEYFVRNEKTTY